MRLTLCGSVAFVHEMDALRQELEMLGHEVKMPGLQKMGPDGVLIPTTEYYAHKKAAVNNPDHWIWKDHSQAIQDHYRKIEWSEAVVITNYNKNGVDNYIGPNTLIEMGVAFYLGKPIFLLNPVPQISCYEEIIGVKPILIDGNLLLITSALQPL